jgi:hypothetical protein
MKKATDIILFLAGTGRVALPVIVGRDWPGKKELTFSFPAC